MIPINKDIYVGRFLNGDMDGKFKVWFTSGNFYEGDVKAKKI
jgi:hypothetical protein